MSLLLNALEIELLSALNFHKAQYIVVGGHAVAHHGHLREMKDLDLWIAPNLENAQRVSHALASVLFFLSPEQTGKLSEPNTQLYLNMLFIELLTSVTGLEFSSTMARTIIANEGSVSCHVISREDLIANKRLLGRQQDLSDVAALESLTL